MKRLLLGVLSLALPATAQETPLKWEYRQPVGSKWHVINSTTMWATMIIPATPGSGAIKDSQVVHFTSTIEVEVLSKDASGTMTVSHTIRQYDVDTQSTLNGKPESPSALHQPPKIELQPILKVIRGTRLKIKHGPEGEIWNVVGGERAIAQTQAVWPKLNPINTLASRLLLEPFFSQEALKTYLGGGVKRPHLPQQEQQTVTYSKPFPPSPDTAHQMTGSMVLTNRSNGRATYKMREHSESTPLKSETKESRKQTSDTIRTMIVDESTGFILRIESETRTQISTKLQTQNINHLVTIPTWILTKSKQEIRLPKSEQQALSLPKP